GSTWRFLAAVVLPFLVYRVLNEDRVLQSQGRLCRVCRSCAVAPDSHKRYYGTITTKADVSSIGESQRHAIERRRHMGRELGGQHLVVEIGMEVGEHGAPRLHTLNPVQRVLDGEMAGMRDIAQGVDNPDIEAA